MEAALAVQGQGWRFHRLTIGSVLTGNARKLNDALSKLEDL